MHLLADRKSLLSRTNRLIGQLEAVKRKIDSGQDEDCFEVLHLMTSARGALDGLIRLFLDGHIRDHIVEIPDRKKRRKAGEELARSIKAFLK